ncbi:hypothetical protein BJP27_24060 (plasmid) [Pseudomonas oryzihabitans]|nr:hypothetical protein BJP27_24060 [Pseudomonas psychrotolerans]
MPNALTRLRLSGELSEHLASLETVAEPLERVRLSQRVLELLRRLGEGLRGAIRRLSVAIGDPDGSRQSLASYMATDLDGLPPSLAPFERDTVAGLALSAGLEDLGNLARAEAHRAVQATGRDQAYLDVLAELSRTGVTPPFDAQTVLNKHEEAQQLQRESYASSPAYKTLIAEWSDYHTRTNALMIELEQQIGALPKGDPEGKALQQRLDALAAEYKDRRDAMNARNAQQRGDFQADLAARVTALFEVEGLQVIEALRQASPVTQEQAEAWASAQVIDPKALAKLEKQGYPAADLRRDIAEFYRLTGGKASAVRLTTDGGRRANAVGIDTREGEKLINIGTTFTKAILFHELAHHLENDPIARAGANGYLLARRESDQRYRLRDLTGHKGYATSEVAYKDSFLNPYMGKVYDGGITEVFSLGVEYLASPKTAAIMAARDPQLFALITGYLTRDLTPAMQAKLTLHGAAIEDLANAEAREREEYAQALRVLVERITLTPDGWYDGLDAYDRRLLADTCFRAADPQYLGSFGNYRVFAGVFKNQNTGRNTKGHLVVLWEDRYRPEYAYLHGGLDMAKAFIALHQAQGLSFSSLWYAYFYEKLGRSPRRAIISTAQAIQEART